MKTKLLKLALCAFVAALPIGAWADIDFGTEKTVSQKTVWNFNSLTTGTEYNSVTEYQNGYLRNNNTDYTITVNDAPAESTITLSDGSEVSIERVLTLKKSNFSGGVGTAANTTGYMRSTFAFNAEVAGTVVVYMKSSQAASNNLRIFHTSKVDKNSNLSALKYISSNGNIQILAATSTEKGTFFIGDNGSVKVEQTTINNTCNIYAVEFYPSVTVGAKTLWTFGQYPDNTTLRNTERIERVPYDGLFFHKNTNASHSIKANSAFEVDIAAADFGGEALSSRMTPINFAGKHNTPVATFKAGDLDYSYDGMAFNASCAGTTYVAFRTPYASTDYSSRSFTIYFNGTAGSDDATQSYTNRGTYVVKYTSTEAGTFATYHSTGAIEIIAVLFVPTNASATDTKEVNISDAGVATFSSARSYTIADTGLKAYKVSEVDESKATLTDIGNIIPAYTGVVLAGDEGTYTLTTTSESATVSNNSLVANVGEYILPANDGKGNYNYTLAAGPTFKHSSGSGTLAAGKAFLRTTTDVSARGLELNFDEGETTGISEIEKLRNVGNEKFFDLQGRLVAQPTRGLYIVNGKKVIIK